MYLALQSCQVESINVLLHLFPLDIKIEYVDQQSQSNILDEVLQGLWEFLLDYAIWNRSFKKNFVIGFPTKAE